MKVFGKRYTVNIFFVKVMKVMMVMILPCHVK